MSKYAGLSFGSLAYDPFSTAAPQFEFPSEREAEQTRPQEPAEAPAVSRRAARREEKKVLTAEEILAEEKARVFRRVVAAVAIPVVAVCAVLLVMLIQSYLRLTVISNEAGKLEKRIAELQAEHSRLEIECESVFNMEEVEQTARSAIGMVKADADQVVYLRSTTEDVAMIMDPPAGESVLDQSAAFFRRILARFQRS